MTHIELIGASGAGKSTIYRELVCRDHKFFSGMFEPLNLHRTLPARISKVIGFTPSRIEKNICKQIWHRYYQPKYANLCYAENPSSLVAISNAIRRLDSNHQKMMTFFYMTAADYIFSKLNSKEDETFIIDEGFTQRALTISAYSYKNPGCDYYNHIPWPDILVHIDCPPETCIRRMEERDREMRLYEIPKLQAISKLRRTASEVTDYASKKNISIIYVENSNDLDDVIARLCSEIDKRT